LDEHTAVFNMKHFANFNPHYAKGSVPHAPRSLKTPLCDEAAPLIDSCAPAKDVEPPVVATSMAAAVAAVATPSRSGGHEACPESLDIEMAPKKVTTAGHAAMLMRSGTGKVANAAVAARVGYGIYGVEITKTLTLAKAVDILHKSSVSTPALTQVTDMLLEGKGDHRHMRKQPKGYSGVEGAKKLLNDMIYESMSKYDAEIAKCTQYYSEQCAAMEVCRGQIAAANYIAANSRALILDSQATINRCEVDIPTRKLELKQHLLKCEHELGKLKTRLKAVAGAPMAKVLAQAEKDATDAIDALAKTPDSASGRKYLAFRLGMKVYTEQRLKFVQQLAGQAGSGGPSAALASSGGGASVGSPAAPTAAS